jgi:hypothetical protein
MTPNRQVYHRGDVRIMLARRRYGRHIWFERHKSRLFRSTDIPHFKHLL